MSASRAGRTTRKRGSAGVSWELVPVIILALGLLVLLAQRAAIVARRIATETPWLAPSLAILAGGIAIGSVVLWLRRGVRARGVAKRQRLVVRDQTRTIDGLRMLTPTAFELVVAELLREIGYRSVTHTGGSGDLCADLACVDATGQRVVVQCKRYGAKKLVGSPEIQQFLGMMTIHHRAEHGLYVTTSGYTRHARALAEAHAPALVLIDGARLASLMQSVR